MFDSHIHLDQLTDAKIKNTMEDPLLSGVLAVSSDLKSAERLLALKRYYKKVHIAAGFHPEQPLPSLEQRDALFDWIIKNHTALAAIGEVGLPYYAKQQNPKLNDQIYIELFEAFIILAKRFELPLNLHIVHTDVSLALDLLEKHHIQFAHFHWFKTDKASLARFIDTPFFASLTPDILWNEKTQIVAKSLPLSRLLIETDSPWPHQGLENCNVSEQLMVVLKKLAEIRNLPIQPLKEQIQQNYQRCYQRG